MSLFCLSSPVSVSCLSSPCIKVASVSLFCLSSPCILCNQGCQCLCFVCLHPVSCVIKVASVICFVCLHPVSCVIKVASVFVLFFFTLYLV